jgi:hypothetical protein
MPRLVFGLIFYHRVFQIFCHFEFKVAAKLKTKPLYLCSKTPFLSLYSAPVSTLKVELCERSLHAIKDTFSFIAGYSISEEKSVNCAV